MFDHIWLIWYLSGSLSPSSTNEMAMGKPPIQWDNAMRIKAGSSGIYHQQYCMQILQLPAWYAQNFGIMAWMKTNVPFPCQPINLLAGFAGKNSLASKQGTTKSSGLSSFSFLTCLFGGSHHFQTDPDENKNVGHGFNHWWLPCLASAAHFCWHAENGPRMYWKEKG